MNLFDRLKINPKASDELLTRPVPHQWKLAYLATGPNKESYVTGEWFFETFQDLLDALQDDYDDDEVIVGNTIVITYLFNGKSL